MDELVKTVLVTALLVIGLLGAFAGAGRVPPTVRVTGYAGFWAGAFLVGIFQITFDAVHGQVVGALGSLPPPVAALIGAALGVLVVSAFAVTRGNRAVGAVFVLHTVIAGAGLLLYYRVESVREPIALLTIGAAIGICLTFFVPRRFVAHFLIRRAERIAARRRALEWSRRVAFERRQIETLSAVVKHYRQDRRRERRRAVSRRFMRLFRDDIEQSW